MSIMRSLPGFSHYGITSNGQVYSYRHTKFMKPSTSKQGYRQIFLKEDKIKYNISVSRLVLLIFRGNPPIGMECCYNNGIKTDNRLGNLRWGTHTSNMQDYIKHRKMRELTVLQGVV